MTEKHIEDSSAPLIDHLIELRTRLIRSILAFVIGMMLCFAVAEQIYEFLAAPLIEALVERGRDPGMIVTAPQEILFTYFSVSMFGGLFLAFPLIAVQLWRFVAPGLYKSEQSAFLPFLIASPLLFVTGAAFAYYGALPLALDFFLSFERQLDPEGAGLAIELNSKVNEYLGLAMKFILAFGICFQLPVALTLMAKAGLMSSEALIRNRKYAIVGLLVLAALFTPPDVFSMLLLFGVIFSLYEVSIFLVKMVEKKREEKLRAEGYYDDEDEEDGDSGEEEDR
ncbi:MAG: twin-arginine translocase subunit TatC [Paracoccaceae bacterium]